MRGPLARFTFVLVFGCLMLAAVPPNVASPIEFMDAPTEAEMTSALAKAADWMLTVTGTDGQIDPPTGSPSWEASSAGRMCLNGMVLLRAYQATEDTDYLDRAKACADLAVKNLEAGKAYVMDRTGASPTEAVAGFVSVQGGMVDDEFQAGYTGSVSFYLWECTRGMLFLIEMYRATNNTSYYNHSALIDSLIHERFAIGGDPANGLYVYVRLSSAGDWTYSSVDSTVEHAVLLYTINEAGENLTNLWGDRTDLIDYIASLAKGDGSYDDRSTLPGQTSSSETQHAIMIAALSDMGETTAASDLAEWVLGQQAANGSFECPHDMDDYGDTSWSTLGLLPYGEVDAGAKAIGWLLGEQKTDGSWPFLPGNPPWASVLYSTEWAALAVYEGLRNINLQINDTMLQTEPIRKGSPARVVGYTVNATVRNEGLASAKNVTVRAYDGDPSLEELVDEVAVEVPALGDKLVSLEFVPQTLGPHEVHVVVSLGTGREFRTTDNTARVDVHINRDPAGVITSPEEGETFPFQGAINFSVHGVTDADEDTVECEWRDNVTGVMSTELSFERVLPPGDHCVTVHLADGNGPGTYLEVNFSVRNNTAPAVVITSPSNGSHYLDFETIELNASATTDVEGHGLTFTWVSNISGLIGQGPVLSIELHPGEHLVTLWVDDGWANVSGEVSFTVLATFPPEVVISSPAPDSEHVATESVHFASEGTTDQDSDTLFYKWTSSIDGPLSDQPSFLGDLSVGLHVITLEVSDGHYNVSKSVEITVRENQPPTAAISSPGSGAQFNSDQLIELNGSVSEDPEDEVTFLWVSDLDGVLGDTPLVETRLSRGEHTITLWVDDGHGHNVSAQVTVTVLNLPPTARIAAPLEDATINEGDEVVLDSTGSSDPEGDDLTFLWVSDLDGVLGDTPLVETHLSRGEHTITLWVDDGHGENVSAKVTVTVINLSPTARIAAPLEDATIKEGDEVELNSTGTSDPEGDDLTFTWEVRKEGGNFEKVSEEASVMYKFHGSGTFEVRLTVSDGVSTNATNVTLEVKPRKSEDGPGPTALAAVLAVTSVWAMVSRRRRRGGKG